MERKRQLFYSWRLVCGTRLIAGERTNICTFCDYDSVYTIKDLRNPTGKKAYLTNSRLPQSRDMHWSMSLKRLSKTSYRAQDRIVSQNNSKLTLGVKGVEV